MQTREELLNRLRNGEGDGKPLIIGGGINGIGVLRDLAEQDVPAILVEAGDFACGASAAPSRLIHGGLRYLETGEFALVRESVEERNRLLLNAPHQVTPLPVWVPALSYFGGATTAGLRFLKLRRDPGSKGALIIRLGLWVFDRFGNFRRSMPRHRVIALAKARARLPLSSRVRAVLEYYDARLHSPERLALEIVADAEARNAGAMAINWLALEDMKDGAVILSDRIDGETFAIRPSVVVNCAGAWGDRVNAGLGIKTDLIGGNRGSHLVMERPDLARSLGDSMLYFETHDFRACLIYALDDRMILLGTTDLRDADPDGAACSEDEIDYLFRVMEEILPDSAPAREQIRFAFSGVRPLPRTDGGATGAVSRDHTFIDHAPAPGRPFPMLTLVGGKWTTYRACAEQLTDRILARLGARRQASTCDLPIGGGAGFPREAAGHTQLLSDVESRGGISRVDAERLVRRYGTRATAIADSLDEAGRTPVPTLRTYLTGELTWILRHERVERLEDLVLRRTLMVFEGIVTPDTLEVLAELTAGELGWEAERQRQEVERVVNLLAERGRVPGFAKAAQNGQRASA